MSVNISTPTSRLLALDVFRGLTIALMFIVNNPGTWSFIYPPLEHAKWHGWTPTDWVYPFFLFTVGVAAWFSFKKHAGHAPADLYFKIIKRGLLIFLIGIGLAMYMNSLSNFSNLRIMGVLQRIGLAYMLGCLICITFSQRTTALIGAGILIGYWLLMKYMSDPLYPFGLHDGTQYLGIENNVVTKFDQWALGAKHLYKGYGGIPFDPEGLLSTLPAIVTVIIGYFSGKLIDLNPNRKELVKKLLIWGLAALILGWVMNLEFPINKPIWSSSYVVFMAGWCLLLNGILIWIIDIQGLKSWTKPILVLGMNSLLAFVISGMWVKTISKIKFDSSYETVKQANTNNSNVPKKIGGTQKLYEDVFSPITTERQLLKDYKNKKLTEKSDPSVWSDFEAKQKLSSFFYALFNLFLFWFFLWIFYNNGIFLKV